MNDASPMRGMMRGMDAAFLGMERPSVPMHTVKVLRFSGAPPPTEEQLRRCARLWVSRFPVLRAKVVHTPLRLSQPFLVDAGAIHWEHHLRRIEQGKPLSERELEARVSEAASELLPRDRPLWHVTVWAPLEGGGWAAILKIHHALADGARAAHAFADIFGPSPSRPSFTANGDDVRSEAPALPLLLLADLRALLRMVGRAPVLVWSALRGRIAVRALRNRTGAEPGHLFRPVHVSFNRRVTRRRRFMSVQIDLHRLRRLKDATHTTLNDVWLALMSGALRTYLIARGELPSQELTASVPVAATADAGRNWGNQVSSVFAPVPVHVLSARERLQIVHRAMNAAKGELELRGVDAESWTSFIPPAVLRLSGWIGEHLGSGRMPPAVNLVLSNVHGPEPLAWRGGRLERITSSGPLLARTGLNVTAWSYRDALDVGLVACPELNADLEVLANAIEPALQELEAELLGSRARVQGLRRA